MDNKLLSYINHRVEEQNKIYGGIEEVHIMMGGKKKKIKKNEFFYPDDKIGYATKKVIKLNCHQNELKISQLIKDNPHKNLIKIYDVDKKRKEIIMERFDGKQPTKRTGATHRYPKKSEFKKYLKDIKSSLYQLNKIGIVQLDLKFDNIAYSTKDKVWKVFDFDFSGIYKKNNKEPWILKPRPLRQISPVIDKLKLKPSEIDKYLFKYFEKYLIQTGDVSIRGSYKYITLMKYSDSYKKLVKKSRKSSKKKSRKKSSKKKSRRKSRKSRKKSSKKKSRKKSSKKKSRRKSSKKKSRRKSSRRKSRKSRKSKRKSRKSKRKSR